jgi:hypothetical protein
MITKHELDKILIEINQILAGLNKRIEDLESAKPPRTTKTPKSQEIT